MCKEQQTKKAGVQCVSVVKIYFLQFFFFFGLVQFTTIYGNVALQPNKKFLTKKRRKPLHQLRPSPHFTDSYIFFFDFFFWFVRLTLELIAVCDFTLPVTSLFIDVKRQSTGASDLF